MGIEEHTDIEDFAEDDPDLQRFVVYRFLTYLLSLIVEALTGRLPEPAEE
jgi:hypothetical protein